MKFWYYFNRTALIEAVENENLDIVKLLLTNENLDINAIEILNKNIYKIQILIFKPRP